jgi:hypothetical protein
MRIVEVQLYYSRPWHQMEVSDQRQDRAALPPRKKTLGESQSLSERCGEGKNLFPLAGIEFQPCSPYGVAIPTELFNNYLTFIRI